MTGRPARTSAPPAARATPRVPAAPARAGTLLPAAADDRLAECVGSCCAAARGAQAEWANGRLRDRLQILRRLRLAVADDPRALAVTVPRENVAETLAAEVLPLLDACRFLELEAPRILRERTLGRRGRPTWLWGNAVRLRPEPLGVALVVGPANYPLMLPGIQALQALAAGNGVLVKPAPHGSACLRSLLSLARSAGLPEGLLQLLPEAPEAAAAAIRTGVDKVFLTGSAGAGRAVSRELAESTTPAVMELSGCDAVFLLEDADLDLVSDCLSWGLTLNQGRTCLAPRRVFARPWQAAAVVPRLASKLEQRARAAVASRNGCETPAGSSASPRAAAACLSIGAARSARLQEELIAEAVRDGAELVVAPLAGGTPGDAGEVAILDRVSSRMSIARTDLFAPVVSFIRVDSDADALRENAQCPLALGATVFGSRASCQAFARRIPAGCVAINDLIVPTADPRVPFGGRWMSGHGKTRGEAGLLEMTHLKAIVAPRRWFKPHLHEPTAADADALQQLIRLEHAGNRLQSLSAAPKLLQATIRQVKLRSLTRRRPALAALSDDGADDGDLRGAASE